MQPSHRGLRYAERLIFSVPCHWKETIMSDDELRTENDRLRAQLHRQTVDAAIESDVRAGRVLPAAREKFRRLMKLSDADDASYARVTARDWQDFAATQPRPPSRGPASAAIHADAGSGGGADARLVQMTREYMRENGLRYLQENGQRLDFGRAAAIVAREQAETGLLRSWIEQPGEM